MIKRKKMVGPQQKYVVDFEFQVDLWGYKNGRSQFTSIQSFKEILVYSCQVNEHITWNL